MPVRTFHPTSKQIDGVWLLDDRALSDLDVELDEICDQLNAIRRQTIQKQIRRARDRINKDDFYSSDEELKEDALKRSKTEIESEYYNSRDRCRVVLHCKDDRRLEFPRFRDVISSAETRGQIPLYFDVLIENGRIGANLSLRGNQIDVNVSPDEDETASSVFVRLERWARSNRSSQLHHFWAACAPVAASLAITIGVMTLIAVLLLSVSSADRIDKGALRKEARALLKDGISSDEQTEAVALLLSFVGEVSPDDQYTTRTTFLPQSIGVLVLCAATAIAAILYPVSAIGIGEGARILARRRRWIRFVTYVAPGFLLCGVLASFFGSELHRLVLAYFEK